MKKYILVILVALFSFKSFAGSGKAIVPHWYGANYIETVVWVTNITDTPVNINVTPYDKVGNVVVPSRIEGLINGNTQLAGRSSAFFMVTVPFNTYNHGHMTIEWSDLQGNNNAVALVAHGHAVGSHNPSSKRSDYAVPINNGMPF